MIKRIMILALVVIVCGQIVYISIAAGGYTSAQLVEPTYYWYGRAPDYLDNSSLADLLGLPVAMLTKGRIPTGETYYDPEYGDLAITAYGIAITFPGPLTEAELDVADRALANFGLWRDPSGIIVPTMPHSQHIAKIVDIDPSRAKPVTVRRKWMGEIEDCNCLATLGALDLYQAGRLDIGDYVIVSFIDENPDTEEVSICIVTDGIYNSW